MEPHTDSKARRLALHEQAQQLHDAGDEDAAIALYQAAIDADPEGAATSHYNIGLIYKYRKQWQQSFDANLRANALDPDDEAARWNLAIAATALQDWTSARRAWAEQGLELGGQGPIVADFGRTPVRLDPEGSGEVVWARRIDPVRARIDSIPLPESGVCCGDIVLHDGAAVGYRELDERRYPVFNMLEMVEPSALSTFELQIDLPDADAAERLAAALSAAGLQSEDWTASIHTICRQCSEGVPHQHGPEVQAAWVAPRRIGIAATVSAAIEAVLAAWQAEGGAPGVLECVLAADEFEQD